MFVHFLIFHVLTISLEIINNEGYRNVINTKLWKCAEQIATSFHAQVYTNVSQLFIYTFFCYSKFFISVYIYVFMNT